MSEHGQLRATKREKKVTHLGHNVVLVLVEVGLNLCRCAGRREVHLLELELFGETTELVLREGGGQ
jgi:hypothetical protein